MGKQVSFYMFGEDFTEIETKIRKKDDIIFLYKRQPSPEMLLAPTLKFPDGQIDRADISLYLCRSDDLKALSLRQSSFYGCPYIDINRSFVVEFIRPHINGNEMRRGRFYFTNGFWDNDNQWQYKDEEFIKWANRLLRLARRMCPEKVIGGFATQRAITWKKDNNGRFRQI
jgi:hypothetical protein